MYPLDRTVATKRAIGPNRGITNNYRAELFTASKARGELGGTVPRPELVPNLHQLDPKSNTYVGYLV
jgi:hypothetical protein